MELGAWPGEEDEVAEARKRHLGGLVWCLCFDASKRLVETAGP